ncbi:uncharacterized protein LOC101854469 [Aplysia californica]|uniref:arylamine N-acetyltransferase n=1 Tax=Aplysia californica TaxID=6500 RepID=A0ABM0KAH2_APLCA|nr:uncharacterized protein LOC101854469 [Aplysia californica]
MSMFTKDEALSFLKNNLKVRDVEKRLETDRRSLLDDFVVAMQTQLVFQNLRLLSVPKAQRRRQTVEEIKSDLLSGVGGLCYNLNVSAFFLLQALGYRASMVHATCTSSVLFPDNHVVVYVCDVATPGDKFLVEVGFGFPTYRAISLDFEKESPEYIDSFIEYKYIRHEGKVLRMHRKGCPIRAMGKKNPLVDFVVGDWRRFYLVEPESTTQLAEFDEDFDQVFQNPAASPFHGSFRVIGFPNRKAVMVVNQKTMIEDDKGDLQVSAIEGGDDGVVAKVKELFPVLPDQLVQDAMTNFRASS